MSTLSSFSTNYVRECPKGNFQDILDHHETSTGGYGCGLYRSQKKKAEDFRREYAYLDRTEESWIRPGI